MLCHFSVRRVVLLCAILALVPPATHAKRIIFAGDDQLISWAAGHFLHNPLPDDIVMLERDGYSINDAWGLVTDGDEFIITAQGDTGLIMLDGRGWGGFATLPAAPGTGLCAPYVLPPRQLNNVTVNLLVCNSAIDPDFGGPQRAVSDTFADVLNGTGNTIIGKTFGLFVSFCPHFEDGTSEQQDNAMHCLGDLATAAGFSGPGRVNQWLATLDYWEQHALQDDIENCARDTGDVWIWYQYDPPIASPHHPSPPVHTNKHGFEQEEFDDFLCQFRMACGASCGAAVPALSPWHVAGLCALLGVGGMLVERRRTA